MRRSGGTTPRHRSVVLILEDRRRGASGSCPSLRVDWAHGGPVMR